MQGVEYGWVTVYGMGENAVLLGGQKERRRQPTVFLKLSSVEP